LRQFAAVNFLSDIFPKQCFRQRPQPQIWRKFGAKIPPFSRHDINAFQHPSTPFNVSHPRAK
jgi:hypothetical protein